MDDTVPVAIVKGTGNLATELPCLLFFQFPVGNNVVEHLPAIDIFEEHIPVVIGSNYVSKAADMRVLQEGNDSSFAGCAYFL